MTGGDVELRIRTVMDISDVKANVGTLQAQFNKLKLPTGITNKFNQEITKFAGTYEKYQQKMSQGIKTKGDASQTSKYLNEIAKEYDNIVKIYSKASGMDLKSMFKVDSGPLKAAAAEVEKYTKQLQSVDINKTGFKNLGQQLSGILKSSKFSGQNGLINQMLGHFEKGEVEKAKQALQEISNEFEKRTYSTISKQQNGQEIIRQKPGTYSQANTDMGRQLLGQMSTMADQAGQKIQATQQQVNVATQKFDGLLQKGVNTFRGIGDAALKERENVRGAVDENKNLVDSMASAQQQTQMLTNRIAMYFSLYEIIRKIGDVARSAFQTVKELDASMTQTAVVTNFDVGDMWAKLPEYTAAANQLGSTIKDVYDATTLYYQQGLNSSQAMGVAVETLKMARIGGIEAAEATDMMTAALRGFNMQINEMSAQNINDVYSKLAAITASNTQELGEAMTRTASIANSAGMEFGNTSAFLAQMIETTREAPENLGTAMKTIIARFQEMKKSPGELIDIDGEMLDANRVDKALKSIGVSLMDTTGEFRQLDKVFLEISEKWDSLTMGQQRYIATMAAGSRQQSRFIALMGNHERLMELVGAANTSAGASQEQFNKTLESMDTKLNKLKNAWDQFAMGLTNSTILKGAIDGLTTGMTVINKFIDLIGKISPKPFAGINKSLITLVGTLGALRLGGSAFFKHQGLLGGLLTGAGKFFQGESFNSIGQSIKDGIAGQKDEAQTAGQQIFQSFKTGFDKEAKGADLGTTIQNNLAAIKAKESGAITADKQLTSINDLSADEAISKIDKALSNADIDNVARDKAQRLLESFDKALGEGKQIDASKILNDVNNTLQPNGGKPIITPADLGVKVVPESQPSKEQSDAQKETNQQVKEGAKNQEELNKALEGGVKPSLDLANRTRQFGMALRGTPLEPFGNMLIKISGFMTGFSDALQDAKGAFNAAGGGLKGMGAGLKSFWGSIGVMGQLVVVVLAVVAAYKALDYIMNHTSRVLKDQANAAADGFSSLKQESSELEDKLTQISDLDNAFKGLVKGTADFNENILKSNELIDELVKKYPSLNIEKYISTDANGRKSISQTGIDAIKDEMNQRRATAEALKSLTANAVKQDELQNEEAQARLELNNASRFTYRRNENGTMSYRKANEAERQELQSSLDKYVKEQEVENQKTYESIGQALANANTNIENKELASNLIGSQYEKIMEGIADGTKKQMGEAYAALYNYEFDSTKSTFTDRNTGEDVTEQANEAGWDDQQVYKYIKATELAGDKIESIIPITQKLDSELSKTWDDGSGKADSLISDLMSNDVTMDPKLLEQIKNGSFEGLEKTLSKSEKKALKDFGIDNIEAYIKERAKAIQDAQKAQDDELATMLTRSSNLDLSEFITGTDAAKQKINEIKDQLSSLTAAQKKFLTDTGKGIEDAFGSSAMSSFMNTFMEGGKEVRKQLQNSLKGVDWSSSISQLKAVTKLTDSQNNKVKQLGQTLKDTANGNNLLSSSIQEVLSAEDYTKAAESMDNFVDSTGHLDATGIQKMAEESGTLSKLLDTNAISAGALASVLNATSIDGVADITDLGDSILTLIGYFHQLDDTISTTHNYIENFDPGIDTGEGADFITENIKKANEFIDNREWGNQQLHGLVQSVVGEEQWRTTLQKFSGDYKKTINALKPQIDSFSEGYGQMWRNLAEGKDSTGKKINFKDVDKNLRGINFRAEDGKIKLELDGKSTEELNEWFQQTQHVSKEQADLMIQDWMNRSPDFYKDAQRNNFRAGLREGDFIQERAANGRFAITESELQTLVNTTGQSQKEILTQIKASAEEQGIDIKQMVSGFDNLKDNGKLRTDYDKLAEDYNKALSLNKQNGFITQDKFLNQNQSGYDIDKIISGYINAGFAQSQAQGMAFEQMKANGQENFTYNGQEVDLTELNTVDEFVKKLSEIDQNKQWYEIGKQIAQGVEDFILTEETPEQSVSNQPANEYGKLGANSGESERLTENAAEINAAMTNSDLQAGAQALNDLQSKLDLSNGTLLQLQNKFIELNGTSLAELSDKELGKIQETLGMDGISVDEFRSKIESQPFVFRTKLQGDDLKNYVSRLNNLTKGQKKILLNTEINGKQKVSQYLDTITKEFGGKDKKTKKIILQATAEFANGNNKAGNTLIQKLVKNGKLSQGQAEELQQDLKVAYNGSIANPEDLQSALNDKINDLLGKDEKKAEKQVTITTVYKTKGKKAKASNQTASVDYTKGKQAGADDAEAKVNYKLGKQAEPKAKTATVNYEMGTIEKIPSQSATLNLSLGKKSKKLTVSLSAAMGMNYKYSTDKLPDIGSLAGGTKRPSHVGRGHLGPNNNGGLTLTGETGYEVAWLPSEGRSMILGVNGPQMLNLPSDAVVWPHEESKEILRRKSIPFGSEAKGTIMAGSLDSYIDLGPKKPKKPKGAGDNGNGNTGKTGSSKSGSKNTKEILVETKKTLFDKKLYNVTVKILKKNGKISTWWENISKRIAGTERLISKNQSKFDKILSKVGASTGQINNIASTYAKYLKQQIRLNKIVFNNYDKQLKRLDKGTTRSGRRVSNTVRNNRVRNANNGPLAKLNKLRAQLAAAEQTESKKDDRRTKLQIRRLKKSTSYKRAMRRLNKVPALQRVTWDQPVQITYKTTKTKDGKTTTKTRKKTTKVKRTRAVDFSKIIYRDPKTGEYLLNAKAINKAGKTKAARKAIKEKGQKLVDEKNKRRNDAQDKIEAARESLRKIADDMYNAFNFWERSLNRIYLISQKIEALEKTLSVRTAQEELLSTKIKSGYEVYSENTVKALTDIFKKEIQLRVESAEAAIAEINQARKDYEQALDFSSYIKNAANGVANGLSGDLGKAQITAAKMARDIFNDYGLGDLENFDYNKFVNGAKEAFEKIRKSSAEYNNTTWEEVKKILDNIADKQQAYQDATEKGYKSVEEIYSQLLEYKEYINEFEEKLIDGLEEEINKQIDVYSKLNSALSNAYKDLLDEVKKRLDERRQKEDNAKTEFDIAKKQQRLAALRADTSGGKASEIKRLEQEIAEAQQNYGRTLEDQLLQKLQDQGDQAAKQRERQIKIMEAQRDLAKALGTNLEQVKEWLSDPNKYYNEIRNAWLAANNYDEALPKQREKLENEFEEAFTRYKSSLNAVDFLEDFLNKTNPDAVNQITAPSMESKLDEIIKDLEEIKQVSRKSNLKKSGVSAAQLKALGYGAKFGITEGYSAGELRKAGYGSGAIARAASSSFGKTPEGKKQAQNYIGGMSTGAGGHLNAAGTREARQAKGVVKLYEYDVTTGKAADKYSGKYDINTINPYNAAGASALNNNKAEFKEAVKYAITHQKPGTQINPNMSKIIDILKIANKSYTLQNGAKAHLGAQGTLWWGNKQGINWWNTTKKKDNLGHKNYNKKSFIEEIKKTNKGSAKYIEYAQALRANKVKGYKTGGLATQTGPAWLDGTRAKPELVLNAADTKNFIALKDILSTAMNGINSMEGGTTYGDSTYEININVDHLNNDYDVDKVAKRVEKIITQDASYRNVTMVRKFR